MGRAQVGVLICASSKDQARQRPLPGFLFCVLPAFFSPPFGRGLSEKLAEAGRAWQAHNMIMKRTIHDEGHRRKFLVVVDETQECDRAITYAAYRAAATGGGLTMMISIEPAQFQHWLGVKEIMQAEAQDAAHERLEHFKERVEQMVSVPIECVIRQGKVSEQIVELIDEDKDIGILVLATAVGSKDGPGPLVSSISSQSANSFPIPVTIVPGNLGDEDIQALC